MNTVSKVFDLGLLHSRLLLLDYASLPISAYNRDYITSMLPVLRYYLEIYVDCLRRGISSGCAVSSLTLIDYGGGHGFLSILAKQLGIGQVIYIDKNPLSVETVTVLKRELGIGPDVILCGDSSDLLSYCQVEGIKPDLLIGTDLIEHVYDLSAFFANVCVLNAAMPMVFTTASTPFNPFVVYRLHRFMRSCESGDRVVPNYYTRRAEFIHDHYPAFSSREVSLWSHRTRGLIYADMVRAIDSGIIPILPGRYNTCDPATGNWSERILPMRAYRAHLSSRGYTLSIGKGCYNTHQSGYLKRVICRLLNFFISWSGQIGLLLSPYIILECSPSNWLFSRCDKKGKGV